MGWGTFKNQHFLAVGFYDWCGDDVVVFGDGTKIPNFIPFHPITITSNDGIPSHLNTTDHLPIFNHFLVYFIWPAPLAEPRSEYNIFFQNSRATFASSPFSYRGKSHSVRLRGVCPKIHRKRPKTKRVRVDENVNIGSVAFSYLLLLSRTCDSSYTPYW